MDLSTAADLAQVLEGLAVAGAIVFAVAQVRQFRRQRQDAIAQLFISRWDGESMRQLDIVYALPDAAPPERVESDAQTLRAANSVYVNLEQLGLLVHGRTIALETANEWAGGAVRVAWRTLRPWIEAKRRIAGSERPGEWFQWLAERLGELPRRDERVGAHVAHAAWRP
ncbi:MAG TPA: hypothetical protein VM582_07465 [Candidatus Thermoplasmatota archaeon]|nr:hypothetical protein [Candidatus Thermoplasmatota archaeon]